MPRVGKQDAPQQRLVVAAVLAVLVIVGGLLVRHGTFARLDQWSVDHLMRSVDTSGQPYTALTLGQFRPFATGSPLWDEILATIVFPASAVVSGLVVAVVAAVFARRQRLDLAALVVGIWVAANALETLLKHELLRPGVYATRPDGTLVRIASFDHSYPSGHALRACVTAFVIALAWRSSVPLVALWAAAAPAILVVTGAHVLTDVVGGALLGIAFCLVASVVADRRGEGCRVRSG